MPAERLGRAPGEEGGAGWFGAIRARILTLPTMSEGWRYVAVAAEAALVAGALQRARYGDVNLKVEHKGEINLVTDVDRASEAAILEVIRRAFPDHDVVTEETSFERTGSRHVWFIDPL